MLLQNRVSKGTNQYYGLHSYSASSSVHSTSITVLGLLLKKKKKKKSYRMGTNFQGWLNFAVFESTSQTAKIILAKFWEATPTQEQSPLLGKTSSRIALLRYFRPTTDHWRETLVCCFLCHHLITDPQVYHRTKKGVVITPITNLRKLEPFKIWCFSKNAKF